ncbi:phosphatase PAP2/dual specificity phosphatase family protein [Pseudomonas rubra]|uniref:Phosphatase PAP2/dual specificity phosphatase family protein n=1 Tax=Pseudomonas rubra TaxID=2942627 RepID=A0ABT5PDU0_9PSED|nr:phosphatase PAP2/dual specificity phosphatase family protein [Pseudomonas rubra]MDD1016360.1 phosphatase PAP2/dual specificity phosphatase family protein [Pseudomonas rubra]MDD1041683.1 phosphatase PAP2/dual specificity phosphatase family protein [Pseudomonas rubra]MDD1157153.1 phosphatase PAP2/dual specificity phosphatase family protein [Pseudomonas rubra]
MSTAREPGLIKRGVLWLLLLGPLFFLSYGLTNTYTAGRSDVGSLVFAWEGNIPLWPWTIIPYWSIDLLYGLSFLLPLNRREMDRHALRLLSAQLICILGFLLWPLRFTVERPALDGLFGWLFDVLMGFDKPFNQAPSLHIALLVIIWAMFARHIHARLPRLLVHGWMALIGVSVLTTWQHHFIDLPSGALVGVLCCWLWPVAGQPVLRPMQLVRDPQRWRLALRYGAGATLLAGLALYLGGVALWLMWPAVALLLVALNYAQLGVEGFQKGADGQLSFAVRWLLAPYLVGAWLNSRGWTRRRPQADEVCDGVYLGRIPGKGEAAHFAAIVDLCAELPAAVAPGHAYCALPSLDLVVPTAERCREAALAIEQLRAQGPVLVCCALGYSRSASAVAAWLVLSGRCANAAQAQQRISQARPGVVLHAQHLQVIERLQTEPCQ